MPAFAFQLTRPKVEEAGAVRYTIQGYLKNPGFASPSFGRPSYTNNIITAPQARPRMGLGITAYEHHRLGLYKQPSTVALSINDASRRLKSTRLCWYRMSARYPGLGWTEVLAVASKVSFAV